MHVIVSGPALPAGVVSAAWKIVYVPVPKAACTSMLWTLADVQQETAEPLGIASSAAVTRSGDAQRSCTPSPQRSGLASAATTSG
jgi:hypothetical protein